MKRVEAYFDYASPWAYLASEIAERKLPGVTVDWRPIYLRGVETFAHGLPYGSAKLAYITRDIVRCAEHEGVTLTAPAKFPIDGLHAVRGGIVAKQRGAFERYHRIMFRAAWAKQRDISDKTVVAALLAEAIGMNIADADAALADPALKARLREDTEHAVARGLFGVPSFFVGDEMFWGHDRMEYVLRAARS